MSLTIADLRPQVIEYAPIHPTHGTLPVKLRIQPSSAPAVKRKSLAAMSHLKSLEKAESEDDFVKVMTELERGTAETAAAAVLGWDNDELMGGAYSVGYCLSLMKDSDFGWLRAQVNAVVQNQAAFFRAPAAPATEGSEAGS